MNPQFLSGPDLSADRQLHTSITTVSDGRWIGRRCSSSTNDVVRSDIHSTDAFGYSEAIFATSHLLGFSYTPRFKNLKRQRLYIFKNRQKDDRSTWRIKPTGYCDVDRVFQYWDDILRFIATIKLKETTASDL